MKRSYFLAVCAAVLLSGSAYAQAGAGKTDNNGPAPTRAVAISRAKDRLEMMKKREAGLQNYLKKLEAMSDKDWDAKKAERQQRYDAWRARQQQNGAAPTAAKPAAAPAASAPVKKQ
jgi:hypothetical protein